MSDSFVLWTAFNAFVLGMLALDLGVFHRKSHEVTMKEALAWTSVWIALAMVFNLFIYYYFDKGKAVEFFTGYLIEKSLSIDNIFVVIMIFSYFSVPTAYQHKVLFWGILGALVMRVIFILVGVELIHSFHWLIYIFGGFLVFTGIKMFSSDNTGFNPEKNPLVKLARKIFRFTSDYEGDKFFVKRNSELWQHRCFLSSSLLKLPT